MTLKQFLTATISAAFAVCTVILACNAEESAVQQTCNTELECSYEHQVSVLEQETRDLFQAHELDIIGKLEGTVETLNALERIAWWKRVTQELREAETIDEFLQGLWPPEAE